MKKFLMLVLLLALVVLAPSHVSQASGLSGKLSGRILLQVESKGEAWYVNPKNEYRYYLGRPNDAFEIMRELGLGISNKDFDSFKGYAPKRLSGKILLKVEDSGKAYYVNPLDLKMHYLGRPADAFSLMRNLGLGISNNDIAQIKKSKPLTIGYVKTGSLYYKGEFLKPGYYEMEDYCYDNSSSKPAFHGNELKKYSLFNGNEITFGDKECECVDGACVDENTTAPEQTEQPAPEPINQPADDILLYEDATRSISIKQKEAPYDMANLKCYDVYINKQKVESVAADVCFFSGSTKFYKTDLNDWFVFYNQYSEPELFLSTNWLFINIVSGEALITNETTTLTGLCKKSSSQIVKLSDGYRLLVDDVDSDACGNKNDSSPKFNGFKISQTIKNLEGTYNFSQVDAYNSIEKENLFCATKIEEPAKIFEVCDTEKKVMGFSYDFGKMYFTAGSDYVVGGETKNWKNTYTWNLKTNEIVKEDPGEKIQIEFIKSF